MDWKRSKNQVLSVALLLATAGCATTSHETAKKAEEPAPAPATAIADAKIAPAAPAAAQSVNDISAATEKFAQGQDNNPATNNYPDIWARIRAGFAMPPLDSPLVDQELNWFVNNPEYMQRMMERARLYLYYIADEVQKRKMPMEIALLPAIESAYKPHAYSRARAVGLWQFIPSTGRLYGLKANWWYDGRRDVQASTQAALDYLEKLHDDFDGDWQLALAAYNAGEGKVARMMEYNRRHGRPTDYEYLKLRRETQHYVPKLMAMARIVADPAKYGVQLADIPNEPYFARVDTDSQVDLGVVAKLVDVPVDDLHDINPGYKRWATDPNGPHHLLVPVDKKEALIEGLNNLPESDRVQWRHHKVRRGDTLSEISRHYGIEVKVLKTANNLHSSMLHIGQDLLIPISARPLSPAVVRTAFRPSSRTAAHSGEPVIHRVRRGETLWSIAHRYGVMVRQITKWNFIHAGDVLRLGQRLKIWTSDGPTASIEIADSNS
jgi:membrane-bound lytic murein transglycosylase D